MEAGNTRHCGWWRACRSSLRNQVECIHRRQWHRLDPLHARMQDHLLVAVPPRCRRVSTCKNSTLALDRVLTVTKKLFGFRGRFHWPGRTVYLYVVQSFSHRRFASPRFVSRYIHGRDQDRSCHCSVEDCQYDCGRIDFGIDGGWTTEGDGFWGNHRITWAFPPGSVMRVYVVTAHSKVTLA